MSCIHCVNLHAQHSAVFPIVVNVHVACEPLCKWNKKKNIQGQDGRAKLSVSVLDVFLLFLTLSMRTVVFCSALAIQHQQSAHAQFAGHSNPHSSKTEMSDQD